MALIEITADFTKMVKAIRGLTEAVKEGIAVFRPPSPPKWEKPRDNQVSYMTDERSLDASLGSASEEYAKMSPREQDLLVEELFREDRRS